MILFIGVSVFSLFCGTFILYASISEDRFESRSIDALKSLPYMTWKAADKKTRNKSGVTIYKPDKSYKGINIYNSRNQSKAVLMDMKGNKLHSWKIKNKGNGGWQHIEMCGNGDLLVIENNRSLVRLDWNSRLKWRIKGNYHHDIAVAKNGDIYVLSREKKFVSKSFFPMFIQDNCISILSSNGKIKRKISYFELFKKDIPLARFIQAYKWMLSPSTIKLILKGADQEDIYKKLKNKIGFFHANSLEIIDRDVEGLCKKGDLLISARNMDVVAIVNPDKKQKEWMWGPGVISHQHHPSLLKNNNILLFDNGVNRQYSRVIEVNPFTKKIEWEYKAPIAKDFYSLTRGGAQRLSNGNTLITNSNSGEVFEITRNGEIVWEFYNPVKHIKKNGKKKIVKRAVIYRMMRFTNEDNYNILKKFKYLY